MPSWVSLILNLRLHSAPLVSHLPLTSWLPNKAPLFRLSYSYTEFLLLLLTSSAANLQGIFQGCKAPAKPW